MERLTANSSNVQIKSLNLPIGANFSQKSKFGARNGVTYDVTMLDGAECVGSVVSIVSPYPHKTAHYVTGRRCTMRLVRVLNETRNRPSS